MTICRQTREHLALCLGAALTLGTAPLTAGEGAVGMYECKKNGVTTFSDQPCGPDQQHIEVDYQRPDPAQARDAAAATHAAEAQAGQIAGAEVLDTEISNTQQHISRLQDEQLSRIAELRRQRFAGSEALDQDAWRAGIDSQIQAVADRYRTAIDRETARLAELQAKRAALPPPQP